ncbi:tyrosine-type recombinase/integrase [Streptosporangiaceae bacterium NEAU-GS5]|nr:tyrosine-type recombinase/integrase [Streptosporangiaceae bacterium NEAU-GS5]
MAKRTVRDTTWHDAYRPKTEKHLIPRLGRPRVKDLSEEDVEAFVTSMQRDGYAPSTIIGCLMILSQALDLAVRRKQIQRNVCKYIEGRPKGSDFEALPPERDEVAVILDALPRRRNGVRWATAAAVGQRRGETLGLTWPMLDLTNLDKATMRIAWEIVRVPWQHGCEDPHACGAAHHLRRCPPTNCPKRRASGRPHVCRTRLCPDGCDGSHPGRCIRAWCAPDCEGHAKACKARRDGGLVMTEPKSKKSKRTVPIPRPLAELLVLHQLAQATEREAGGWVGWGHEPSSCSRRPRPREVVCPKCRRPIARDALVFTKPDGMPVSPSDDWREWSSFLAELGLPPYRPHDLRHFSVTLQLEEGVDVGVVADNHGHSSPDFTRRRYQHVAERVQRESADQVGKVLWRSAGDSSD